MSVVVSYRDNAITFQEFHDEWEALGRRYPNVTAAKAAIDRFLRADNKIPNTPVFVVDFWDITRAVATRRDGDYIWVSGRKGARKRVKASELVLSTPETEAVVSTFHDIQREIKKLNETAKELRDSLPKGI